MSPSLRFALVLVCFALSGFAGLLYETVWTREFSFVFGTSGLAVSTVLAAYMGGLALGAAIAGRLADRVTRPVLVYGLLELGIALTALAVPWAIGASRSLHVALLRGVTDPGSPLALALYLVTSFAILALPTTFMGATLPLLARHAVREDREIGPRIGTLYAINTAGAIAGTLTTAFFLIPSLGLMRTVFAGAALNGLVFLGAAALSRGERVGGEAADARAASGHEAVASQAAPGPAVAEPVGQASPGLRRIVVAVAFGAGVASFTYEVMWVRLLEHVLGGSIYAFAAMLASFLLGIALGGALAARFADAPSRALAGIRWTQVGVALCSLVAYRVVERMPGWIDQESFLGGADATLRLAALATAILLPATLCIGALFPFAVRALARDAGDAAGSSARAYAANTLGAIVGSIAAGFLLLPWLGFAGTLVFAVGLNGLLAVASWWAEPSRRPLRLAPVALILLAVALVRPDTPWGLLRASPIPSQIAPRDDDRDVLFHALGRSASVIAIGTREGIRIRTNGVPESLIVTRGGRSGLVPTARWLGVVPALSRHGAERMLMIGLGGGVALEMIPPSVDRVDVVELEPQVVAANEAVAALRQVDPARDPRLRLRLGDARSVLELEREPYDAIVSQPSHPWTAGSSHLYTRDFFERVKGRLAPGGSFVQWLGLSYVDESLLRAFVATLVDAFPHVRLYLPTETEALFVASAEPLALEAGVDALAASSPDLAVRIGLRTAVDLVAVQALDESGARRFAEGAPLITDDHNVMATRAPRVFRSLLGRIDELLAPHDPLASPAAPVDRWSLLRPLVELGRGRKALRVADSFRVESDRRIARSIVLGSSGRGRERLGELARVPVDHPAHAEASWLVARLQRRAIVADPERGRAMAARFDAGPAAVIEGWGLSARRRFADLARLEPTLAAIPGSAPWGSDALALRVTWRVELGGVERAREALALLERDARWTPERLAVRAATALRAGDGAAARSSLWEIATLGARGRRPAVVTEARRVIDQLGPDVLPASERAELIERLSRSGAAAPPARAVGPRELRERNDDHE